MWFSVLQPEHHKAEYRRVGLELRQDLKTSIASAVAVAINLTSAVVSRVL